MNGPQPPRSQLARMQGITINAEGTKAYGWKQLGILVVAESDDRLSWPERELVRQLGERLYGRCCRKEVRHG